MSTVHVKTASASDEALHSVRAAVASEIARLELALEMAHRRLKPFEEKYEVTSEQFIAEIAAEDLEGGDDEYVQWAGEYKLMCDLKEKLAHIPSEQQQPLNQAVMLEEEDALEWKTAREMLKLAGSEKRDKKLRRPDT